MKSNKLPTCLILVLCTGILAAQPADSSAWSLQDCIDYALRENISLKQSRIAAAQAAVDQKTARASFFPSLSFSAGQQLVNRPYLQGAGTVNGSEIIQTSGNTSYTGTYGLNAQWTLYQGGKRNLSLEQSRIGSRIAGLDTNTVANSLEEEITRTYLQILYAEESVETNRSTLETSEAQLARGRELLSAGSLSQAEYAQLVSQVGNDRYLVVNAETALENYRLQLKQLLELDGTCKLEIKRPDIREEDILRPVPETETVYRLALASRPEIAAARLQTEQAGLNTAIARSAYAPTLSLSAGIGTNHTTGTDYTFSEQIARGWNNSAGLSLSIPIFNNRQTRSAVEQAELQERNAALELEQSCKTLYQTIEGLRLDAAGAQEQYRAAQDKYESCRESYRLVREQFDLGMKNTVELLTEKNNLAAAGQEMLQAKYMALLSLNLLDFYQGTSGD